MILSKENMATRHLRGHRHSPKETGAPGVLNERVSNGKTHVAVLHLES